MNKKYLILALAVVAAIVAGFLSANFPYFLALGVIAFGVIAIFILREPLTGVLLMAFSLPFERLGAFQLGDTTIRLSQIFFLVTVIAWLLSSLFKRKFGFAKNPPIAMLAVFFAINLLSLPNALNLGRSVTVLAFIIFTLAVAFVLPNIVITREQLRRVLLALLIGFAVVGSFGLFQFIGDMIGLPTAVTGLRDLYTKDILGFTRVQSTAYEPLYFANYLLIPIALLLALFLSTSRAGELLSGAVKKSWYLLLFGLGMVDLVLTVSRGAYLAIVFVLLIVGIFFLKRVLNPRYIIAFLVAVVAAGWLVTKILGVGGDFFTQEKIQEHVQNVFYGASYDERVDTIGNAITAWREQPLIGIGPGSFGPYMAANPYYIPKDGWRIVNNEFIEILAENGIFGLLAFCLFIFMLIARSIKAILQTKDNYLKAVMVGLLAAFGGVIVQYQTFSTLYIMHIWFLVGLMVVVQNIIFAEKND